jgi:hypothetical protein
MNNIQLMVNKKLNLKKTKMIIIYIHAKDFPYQNDFMFS